MRLLVLFFFLTFFAEHLNAQCFGSPGNPAAGTSNLGTLKKNVLRINFFQKYSYSDTYFNGHQHSSFVLYDKAYFNYLANLVAYGVSDRFTIEAETGYFLNKTIHYSSELPFVLPEYTLKGYGLTQTVLSAKFLLIPDEKQPYKWSAGLGGKIPLRFHPQFMNNTQLPVDVQPSNMAWGIVAQSYLLRENTFKGLRYFLINRYEYNFTNNYDFKWGQSLYSSLFISKRLHFRKQWLTENWTAVLQLRHEMKSHNFNYLNQDYKVESSGSHLLFLTPQLNYTAKDIWNFSLLFDFPLFQHYNGTQIGNKYGITLSITWDYAPDHTKTNTQ